MAIISSNIISSKTDHGASHTSPKAVMLSLMITKIPISISCYRRPMAQSAQCMRGCKHEPINQKSASPWQLSRPCSISRQEMSREAASTQLAACCNIQTDARTSRRKAASRPPAHALTDPSKAHHRALWEGEGAIPHNFYPQNGRILLALITQGVDSTTKQMIRSKTQSKLKEKKQW